MSEKDRAQPIEPDIDLFTSEIEDTIDDLFTPKKQIEIDPLTQEVKVLSGEEEGTESASSPAEGDEQAPSQETPEIEISLAESLEIEEAEEDKGAEAVEDMSEEAEADLAVEEALSELEIEPEPAASSGSPEQPDQDEEGEDLSFDLEIEPEGAAEQTGAKEASEPGSNAASPVVELDMEEAEAVSSESSSVETAGPPSCLEELKQTIFTIEWEIRSDQIDTALEQIARIEKEIPAMPPEMLSVLIPAMILVLKKIRSAPDEVAPSAPGLLKRSVELMEAAVSGGQLPEEASSLARELEAAAGKEGAVAEDVQELDFEIEPEPASKAQPAEPDSGEMEPAGSEPLVAAGEEVLPEPVSSIQFDHEQKAFPPEAEELLREHLGVIDRLIQKILPVEEVLKEQAGAEKLYQFQASIRRTLQEERDRMSRFFFGQSPASQLDSAGKKAAAGSEAGSEMAEAAALVDQSHPYGELVCLSCDGVKIAVPSDQVALVIRPGFRNKGRIRKAESLRLKELKAWPWSKLAPSAQAGLSGLSEKELSSIELPVIRQIEGQMLEPPSSFVVTVIHDGKTGCILLGSAEPMPLEEDSSDFKWRPGEKGFEKGTLETDDEIIHLIAC